MNWDLPALDDIGGPSDRLAAGLFGFNVGVEAAQIVFVLLAACGLTPIATLMGGVVLFWIVERAATL